ncbi:MAG TPA: AAA family ATPase [Pirellulaceae bacterium]|jgi:uncharacterized protein YhaN|nr:AAA family ATPase [Pirellulaceae bacterium]
MRLLSLHLQAFGPFEDAILPLDDEDAVEPRLTIVYGPNEAGKSTALRAVRHLLFGSGASKDSYRVGSQRVKVGGRIRTDDGVVREILRKGITGKKLFELDGKTSADEGPLDAALGDLDAASYEAKFGLHHEDLEAGARAVLESSGSLNSALFAATAKTKSLQKLQQELLDRAEKLFKPRATTGSKITSVLGEFKKLDDDALRAERAGDVEIYRTVCRNIADQKSKIEALREQKAARQREARSLGLLAELLIPHRKRRELASELASLQDVPTPEEDYEPLRQKLDGERIALEERRRRSQKALADAEASLAELGAPSPLLAHAEEVERLVREAAVVTEERRRAEGLSADRERLAREAEKALARIGSAAVEADLEGLSLPEDFAASLLKSIELRTKYEQQRIDLEERRRDMTTRSNELDATETELSAPGSSASLAEAITTAKVAAGSVAERDRLVAEANAKQAEARAWVSRRMTRPAEVEELAALPVPSVAAIEEEIAAHDRRLDAEAKLAQERDGWSLKRADLQADLRSDEMQGLPSGDDLRTARAGRDAAVRALADDLFAPQPTAGGLFDAADREARQAKLDEALRRIAEADGIADVLRREADRVVRLERARREEQACCEKIAYLESRLTELKAAREAAESERSDRWKDLGARPESPRAALAWRAEWERTVAAVQEARESERRAGDLTRRIDAAREELSKLIGVTNGGQPQAIEKTIALAERRKREWDAAERAAIELASERKRIGEHLREVDRKAERLEESLRAWDIEWDRKLVALPSSADRRPDGALEFLKRFEDWSARRKELAKVECELQAIARRERTFSEDVAALSRRLASQDSEVAPVSDPAGELRGRQAALAQERRREDERRRLRQDAANASAEVAAAEERLAVVVGELTRICSAVGVGEPADLAERLGTVSKKKRALAAARELDEQLASRMPDADWEAVGKELARWTLDSLSDAAAEADDAIERLDEQLQESTQRLGEMERERDAWNGESQAADLVQRKQKHIADLKANAELYAVYRLASAALERSIERYREKNKSPILEKAGKYFAMLTCGAFRGLEPSSDEEGISVVGLRDEDAGEASVAGMSRGTCDQLYLAFRMALWEERLEKGSPLPIVLDDVLVHFDDDRAAATLKAFDELAKRTQIVYFTHHQHLVELAKKTLPADRLLVRELQPAGVRT